MALTAIARSIEPGPDIWTGHLSPIDKMQSPQYLPQPHHGNSTHVYELDSNEMKEIETALDIFKEHELDGPDVSSETFPLPSLGPLLERVTAALHQELGYFTLRGLDPSKHSPEDNLIIFLGVSAYIADKRGAQDGEGTMLKHVRNATEPNKSQFNSLSRYWDSQTPLHTDSCCDLLGMQVRSSSARGGRHIVASMQAVYEDLAANDPATIKVLAKSDWAIDDGSQQRGALFFDHSGHKTFNLTAAVGRSVRTTHAQSEAIAAFQHIAARHAVPLSMLPGDLTYVNNLTMLHSREACEDDEDTRLHLVQLWLKNTALAGDLPAQLSARNAEIYDLDPDDEFWEVIPAPRMPFVRETSPGS